MASKRGWKIAGLGLLTVVMILAVSVVSYAATINGMAVEKTNDRVVIHVNADGPLSYRVLSSNKPHQALILEMSSAVVPEKARKMVNIDRGIVTRARLVQEGDGSSRLVVEVLNPVKYSVSAAPEGKGLVLTLGTQTVAAKVTKSCSKNSRKCPKNAASKGRGSETGCKESKKRIHSRIDSNSSPGAPQTGINLPGKALRSQKP